jgi:hypothetical protein
MRTVYWFGLVFCCVCVWLGVNSPIPPPLGPSSFCPHIGDGCRAGVCACVCVRLGHSQSCGRESLRLGCGQMGCEERGRSGTEVDNFPVISFSWNHKNTHTLYVQRVVKLSFTVRDYIFVLFYLIFDCHNLWPWHIVSYILIWFISLQIDGLAHTNAILYRLNNKQITSLRQLNLYRWSSRRKPTVAEPRGGN